MTIPHIPATIIKQFGGKRAAAMIGGTYMYGADHVTVRFKAKARGGKGAPNAFKIEYNYGLDLYDVEFLRVPSVHALVNGVDTKVTKRLKGVYAEDLGRIFEEETGLYLSF